jgi:lipopolysaccharide export LptBFGC system permease protein LptF
VLATFFLYINVLIGARHAIARGNLAPSPGLWLVHVSFAVIGSLAIGWPALMRRWKRRA